VKEASKAAPASAVKESTEKKWEGMVEGKDFQYQYEELNEYYDEEDDAGVKK